MAEKLIKFALSERFLVIVLSAVLLCSGIFIFKHLDVEAYPDPSPPIMEIIAQNPNWSAEEIERQITVPLETQLNGMPHLEHIRSISLFGLSDIKCYFSYGSDYTLDRQEALNRIGAAALPAGVQPQLSPESAVGEIFRYQLVGPHYTLMDLREAQTWILERKFKQIPGVIDVVSFGGPTKEFHVDLDPKKLASYNLTVGNVMNAVANGNSNVGASYLDLGVQSYNVRGIGLFKNVEDIENSVVSEKKGVPVYLKQLGEVRIGRKIPLGRVGRDHAEDIVEAIVLLRPGEKSISTLAQIHSTVAKLNRDVLPRGMRIVPFYDRTKLIRVTTHTVTHTLAGGMILVSFILLAFLGDLRASLVVALTIPLSLLVTFLVMVIRGESANLISLGAIDFGIIVDASVVMVENIYRHYAMQKIGQENGDSPRSGTVHQANIRRITLEAAKEVSGPIFFSSLIIVAAFLPLFTMRGVEGKIFGPMATTYGFALAGALFLALTFSPVLASLIVRPKSEEDTRFMRWIRIRYIRILRFILSRSGATVRLSLLALILALGTGFFLGGEFLPKLEEGNLWVRATLPTSISFAYAGQLTHEIREVLLSFPEASTVVSQLGRPDDGTDPTSYFNAEFFIPLKPKPDWPSGVNKAVLVDRMDQALQKFPGIVFNFSQNIEDNVEEAMSGVKGENSIKLFGNDLQKLETIADQMAGIMGKVRGIGDLGVLRELGQPNLLIVPKRQEIARYGLQIGDVNGLVQTAIGGQTATQLLDGDRRFDVVVRFLPEYRQGLEAIGSIPVSTPDGGFIPLRQLADIKPKVGGAFIYREDNSRYIPIKFSVRGRDLKSTIAEADRKIRKNVPLPPGYYFEWSGEFQELEEAVARLKVIVPVSLIVIALLLYIAFRKTSDVLLILGAVPLSLIGGIFCLLITHTNFSISAAIGFISLFGVSILEGLVLVSRINHLRKEGKPVYDAVISGCELRVRPVLMVALSAAIGLFPAAVATGIGSETQQPLARVVVGGMITSAVLILLVIPALYYLIHRNESQASGEGKPLPA